MKMLEGLQEPRDWKSRLRAAFHGSEVPDDDVIEELAQHARAMYEAARADGCTPDEAEARVAVQIGRWCRDATALRRHHRRAEAVQAPPADSSRVAGLAHDVKYSLRLLRRQPRFALLVVLTMALGISATTALFSVTYGVLVKSLPWPNGERLVRIEETRGGAAPRFGSITKRGVSHLARPGRDHRRAGRVVVAHDDPDRRRRARAHARGCRHGEPVSRAGSEAADRLDV